MAALIYSEGSAILILILYRNFCRDMICTQLRIPCQVGAWFSVEIWGHCSIIALWQQSACSLQTSRMRLLCADDSTTIKGFPMEGSGYHHSRVHCNCFRGGGVAGNCLHHSSRRCNEVRILGKIFIPGLLVTIDHSSCHSWSVATNCRECARLGEPISQCTRTADHTAYNQVLEIPATTSRERESTRGKHLYNTWDALQIKG